MANTYTQLLVHIVFATKNRAAGIPEDLRDDLYAYIGGIVRGEKCALQAIGGMPDHVHLLIRVSPQTSISELLRKIKANSSRWMRQRVHRDAFRWQEGYSAFTVSQSGAAAVSRYIHHQEEHHRSRSFREEMIEFLDRHGVEYEERYLPG